MTMTANGLAKLIEECGELIQVAGKKLAYYSTEEHPDGGPPLNKRLEEEMADTIASIHLTAGLHNLDRGRIQRRSHDKLCLFKEWHKKEDNNVDGFDEYIGTHPPPLRVYLRRVKPGIRVRREDGLVRKACAHSNSGLRDVINESTWEVSQWDQATIVEIVKEEEEE